MVELANEIDNSIKYIPNWVSVLEPAIILVQGGNVSKTVGYASYIKMGNRCRWQAFLTVTGTSAAMNAVQVGIPFAFEPSMTTSLVRTIGTGTLFNSDKGQYYRMIALPINANAIQFIATNSLAAQYVGAADFTEALAPGDNLSWDIEYQTA